MRYELSLFTDQAASALVAKRVIKNVHVLTARLRGFAWAKNRKRANFMRLSATYFPHVEEWVRDGESWKATLLPPQEVGHAKGP